MDTVRVRSPCYFQHTSALRITSEEFLMKLKLMVAVAVMAALPLCAQAQQGGAKKATNADAQRVVKIISGDKAKTQAYCDMAKIGDQIAQAEEKKDKKT